MLKKTRPIRMGFSFYHMTCIFHLKFENNLIHEDLIREKQPKNVIFNQIQLKCGPLPYHIVHDVVPNFLGF